MIGSMNPHEDAVTVFMQVYLIKCNKAPEYNESDFMEYYWMSVDELADNIARVKIKSDIPLIISKFYKLLK